jgi:ATP-dependent RNA helicase DHX37/DHR1
VSDCKCGSSHTEQLFSDSQAQLSSTIQLQSSSMLGTGRPETGQERTAKGEHVAVKKALSAGQKKYRNSGKVETSDSEIDESDASMNGTTKAIGSARNKPIVIPVEETVDASSHNIKPEYPTIQPVALGGALKRNTDGAVAVPVMRPRKPKKATNTKVCDLTNSFHTEK